MTAPKKWNAIRDPLLRGDATTGVRVPVPAANDSIIRHVLYLEGPGRETPYLSASESMAAANRFAQAGVVWKTSVKVAQANGVGHIGNSALLSLMKGNGKGKAKWDDPFEVMQARRYVEQWSEHLLDFRATSEPQTAINRIFEKA